MLLRQSSTLFAPFEMSQMSVELSAELAPVPETKQKRPRAKKDPTNPKQISKRGQARPYKKISDDLLTLRVTKLTSRLERVKKQVLLECPPPPFLFFDQA